MPAVPQHADSLAEPGDTKQQQKHWIGVTPMDAELVVGRRVVPGLTTFDHGTKALALRETPCFSGSRPVQRGPVPHGLRRRARGQGRAADLLADDLDPVDRRGQLRAARPAAPLHQRQRRDDVLRAGHGRRARRAARRDAGDHALAGLRQRRRPRQEHRPLLDVPGDVHAGLGQLRHGLGGGPPAARHPPGPRPRQPVRDPAAAVGLADRGLQRAARQGRARSSPRPRATAGATGPPSTRAAPRSSGSSSATRCRAARSRSRSRSTAGGPATSGGRPTAAWRSRCARSRGATSWW